MLKTYRSWFWLSIGWLTVMLPPALLADVTGSILGTVTDSSSAIIQGARVTATNLDLNLVVETTSDENGHFRILALPVGRYRLGASFAGFRTFVETGIVLFVNDQRRVDIVLQVGEAQQEINVSDSAVHVETTNTQMGEVIESTKILTVPLNGRSYTDLLALQPGVAPVSSGSYRSFAVSGNLNPGNLSVSGQREGANGFMVNGGYGQEGSSMGTAIVPNLDSIAEFRILTNSADAEYGNYAGGLVNAITKSGTNQFHGNIFEFLRNSQMDARNFFSQSRGVLHQNQFGGTVGGPIRHDKVFFFADYQGTRQVIGVDTGLVPVPSAANQSGDLADVADQLTGTVSGQYWANRLSQGLGYPVSVGESYYTPGCTSSSQCVFPNAVIPQSVWSTPAPKLLQYIPTPNSGSYFTSSANKKTLRDDKGGYRIDVNTRLGLVSGYYFLDDYNFVNPYPQANVPGFQSTNNGRAQMVNLSVTKSFGPRAVNEFRLNYTRNVNFVGVPQGGVGVKLSDLGFVPGAGTGAQYNGGIVPQIPELQGVPKIGFNDFTIGMVQFANNQYSNTYQVLDNFSKVIGTHTLKFGGTAHYDQITSNLVGSDYVEGSFGFNGQETGSDFADFLLGAPSLFEQVAATPFHSRAYYYGLYAQDSWRAKPQLTLNYGLRWEVSSPWYEAFGQQETLVPGLQSVVFPGAPKGWVFPGDPGIPKTISPVRHNNFAPRLGLAYSPSTEGGFWGKLLGGPGKTSIRAAFGVYFAAFEDRQSFQIQGDAPFGFTWVSPTPPLFATPYIDRATGKNNGQRFPVTFPSRNVSAQNPDNSINWAQFRPIASSPGWLPTNRLPYAEHYSFSIQRQFGANTLVSLSYVGTQGHRLLAGLQANPGDPSLCLSVSQPSQVMPGSATCGPFGEDSTYYPVTGGVIYSMRPRFGGPGPEGANFTSNAWFATMSNSSYNAFEATLRHTAGRMEFLAGYTYSKSLDNSSSWGNNGAPTGGEMINFFNAKLSRALSAFDLTHNFVMSYSYHLPFDKLWHANRLTSGWIIAGITRFSTGLPVSLRENDDRSLLGTSSSGGVGQLDVPNFTPGNLNITDPRSANPYFDITLFSKEVIGQLGNANRRFFHGPGLNNWDMALLKDLRLTESKTLQFRAEFFNIFNHTQFGLPSGNILSSSFGFVTSARDPRIGQVGMKFLF